MTKQKDTSKRIAVVMGATSGIGLAVARLFAARGWMVGIAGRREELLKQIVASTDSIACYEAIDITAPDATERLSALITKLGGMHVYVHSSGIGWQNITLEEEKECATADTNVLAFTRMVGYVYRYFENQNGGHIACITSIAGTKGLGAAPAYSASKRYQSQYLEALQQQSAIKNNKILLTDLRPGFVKTPLIEGSNFPLQLQADSVARDIVRAVESRKQVVIIDWKYRLLVFFWRMLPRWLWVRMKISKR